MIQFRNILSTYSNYSFSKESLLVMKEQFDSEVPAESNEDLNLKEKLDTELSKFRTFILDKIHPELTRIMKGAEDASQNIDPINEKIQKRKEQISNEIITLENLISLKIPNEIPDTMDSPEKQKQFFIDTISSHTLENSHTIQNKLTSLFGFLSLINSEASKRISSEYNLNLGQEIKELILFSSACKKLADTPINQSANIQEIPSIEKSRIYEYLQEVSAQISKIPFITDEESTEHIENAMERTELNNIKTLCLNVIDINLTESNDLTRLTVEEMQDLIELVKNYKYRMDEVFYMIDDSKTRTDLLEKLKCINNIIENCYGLEPDSEKEPIPKKLSELVAEMRNNTAFSN